MRKEGLIVMDIFQFFRRRRKKEKIVNKTKAINEPRAKFEKIELGVIDTGLAGKGVDEGNEGYSVAG